jgi:hypothetical protein
MAFSHDICASRKIPRTAATESCRERAKGKEEEGWCAWSKVNGNSSWRGCACTLSRWSPGNHTIVVKQLRVRPSDQVQNASANAHNSSLGTRLFVFWGHGRASNHATSQIIMIVIDRSCTSLASSESFSIATASSSLLVGFQT